MIREVACGGAPLWVRLPQYNAHTTAHVIVNLQALRYSCIGVDIIHLPLLVSQKDEPVAFSTALTSSQLHDPSTLF